MTDSADTSGSARRLMTWTDRKMRALVSHVEKVPFGETVYRRTLESWIADLTDKSHRNPRAEDKVRLLLLAYRARLILEHWERLHAN